MGIGKYLRFAFPISHFALFTLHLAAAHPTQFRKRKSERSRVQGSWQSWGSLRAISGKRRSEEMDRAMLEPDRVQ